jgi:RimJ/RimL family protein N-acetyltransferase
MNSIKIHEISPLEINWIEPLLSNSSFKPYRYLAKGSENHIDQFWINRIAKKTDINKTKSFIAEFSDTPLGFISIRDLPWDSKVFNIAMASITEFVVDPTFGIQYEIGQLLMNEAINWAKQQNYKFLLCKTYSDDITSIHILENSGFILVDTLLDYAIDFRKTHFDDIPPQQIISEDISIRSARPDDEQELVILAKDSFQNHFGRYHSDPNISRENAIKVYTEWMRSSLNGYSDYFLLAEIGGQIAGLSVWKKPTDEEKTIPTRISHYSIGAIHPNFFGRKLFTLLTYEGMKILQGQTDLIDGPTHINNYPVQRGYSRLNWQIYDARHSFHKWLD